jgi:predicted permease
MLQPCPEEDFTTETQRTRSSELQKGLHLNICPTLCPLCLCGDKSFPMRSLISHLRYTIRLLLKSPGFTITAVLILGLGIGLNTAIFSLINNVILKPLSFPEPDRLVKLSMSFQSVEDTKFDYPDYEDINEMQKSFQSLATLYPEDMVHVGEGPAERIEAGFASASIFAVTGRPFILGRPFTESEDKVGGPLIAVISDRFWKNHFSGDPGVIGRTLDVNGRTLQIVGVAPTQVSDWKAADLYVPIHLMRGVDFKARDRHEFVCVGRLKPDVSIESAQSELENLYHVLIERYPAIDKGYAVRASSLLESQISDYKATFWLLGGAVGCLFLVAVANIVNLILVRAWDRRKEVAVRTALGATRIDLIRQLLLEGTCLSVLGAIAGFVFAILAIGAIRVLSPQDGVARFQDVSFDSQTWLFFCGITILSSLLFGVAPAWSRVGSNLSSSLKDEGSIAATHSRERQRAQTGLVTIQVAFACLLLIGAGLLVRSFQMVQSVRLGFNSDHIVTAQLSFFGGKFGRNGGRDIDFSKFYHLLLDRARQLPEVSDAALSGIPPFYGSYSDPFDVPGAPEFDHEHLPLCATQPISPGYFKTLQIPLLAGRDFNGDDRIDSQLVVIISEAMAQRYFPGQNPVGREILFGSLIVGGKMVSHRIIGVAANVYSASPDEQQPACQAYFPSDQDLWNGLVLVLRTTVDPHQLVPTMRKLVASVDMDILVSRAITLDDLIANHSSTRRLGVLLVSLFSGASLLLSAVGLYGVLAYSVSQRKREIGVRIALGAQTWNILRLVVRHGLKIVGVGLLIGIGSALVLTRLIQGVLYGVSNSDPLTLIAAVFVLGLAALFACLLPALNAASIDPIKTLKE